MTKAQILKRYWKLLDAQRDGTLTDEDADNLRYHAQLITLHNANNAENQT